MRSENILQERDRDPVPYRGSTVCTRGKIRCCAGQALGRLGFCGCARPGGYVEAAFLFHDLVVWGVWFSAPLTAFCSAFVLDQAASCA